MTSKWIALLLCTMLMLAATPAALSEGGRILDGRWLCADIEGNVTEDTPAGLKDDFALYVNKPWILQVQIPDGQTAKGSMEDTALALRERQIALMRDDTLSGHDAELVRKLYGLLSDWEYRDAQGVAPIMPSMEAIAAIDSLEALYAFLRSEDNLAGILPVSVDVGVDLSDPDTYITSVGCMKLLLNDAAEYTQRTRAGELYDSVYRQIIRYMLPRLGYGEAEADAAYENAVAFEALLAAHIKPQADHYKPDYRQSLLNYYEPEALAALAGDFPILDMIEASGLSGGKRFRVDEPDNVSALADVFAEANLPLARDWLTVKTAIFGRNYLDREAYLRTITIANDLLEVKGDPDEEEYIVSIASSLLKVPMDNLYIEAYCSQRQRDDIRQIIDEVREGYHDILNENDWLSEETRARAIEKLDAIHVYAVYPDVLGDWSDLDFPGREEGGSLPKVVWTIQRYHAKLNASKIDAPVEKDVWDQMDRPTAVANAAYNASRNTIAVLAGILTGEIYNEDMSYEQKLGAIGTFIGHEISHAFDTNGAQYDKNGMLTNWWSDEDYAAFQERAQKLADWYDGFVPFEDANYSGQQVKTEVIADMGGMRCALHIASQKEDFDYDAFFRQYAAVWRQKATLPSTIMKVSQDKHPMNYMRIDATLAQFDEFDDFYGIKEGDGMYIAPEDRVAVW